VAALQAEALRAEPPRQEEPLRVAVVALRLAVAALRPAVALRLAEVALQVEARLVPGRSEPATQSRTRCPSSKQANGNEGEKSSC
jgi:hypothetical protein